jgi:hypothetical protein
VSEAAFARKVELRAATLADLATRAATQREAATAGKTANTSTARLGYAQAKRRQRSRRPHQL